MDVLLTIDLQQQSVGACTQWDMAGVIARINHLARSVRGAGGQVVHILHDGTRADGLEPQSEGWQLVSALEVASGDICVRKTLNDAFHQSALTQVLRRLEPERLIISGWATDFCVDATVRSAVARGYHVVVAGDCHTLDDRPHLNAPDVVAHHNWVWQHLLATAPVEVRPSAEIFSTFASQV